MTSPKSQHITKTEFAVSRKRREAVLGQHGTTIWFTGLSASGKSTVAVQVDQMLAERGYAATVLDGDNIRFGLNRDLGFSPEDRTENIRRIGEVAKLFAESGIITLTAFISPYRSDRDRVRDIHCGDDFIEVFVDCPLDECERRDPRGLYAKARCGEIPEFTGISAPYEPPLEPELTLHTHNSSVRDCAREVIKLLETRGVLPE